MILYILHLRKKSHKNKVHNIYKTVSTMEQCKKFYDGISMKNHYTSVIISLDNFYQIRNIFGDDGAENYIGHVIDKIDKFIKENECVAKLKGSPRFIIFMEEHTKEKVEKRINNMVDVLSNIKVVKGKTSYDYYGEYCTGYCILDSDKDNFEYTVDKTMLKCKIGYGDNDAEFENREELIKDIESAMEKREFIPYFQPTYDIKRNKIVGSELLARWKHPKFGILNAAKFIPLIEISGYIDELDIIMLEEACIMIQEWIKREVVPVQLAVNISITNFYKLDFMENMFKLVDKYDIPACLIELNIKCVTLSHDEINLQDIFEKLKEKGFHISINNFENGKLRSKLFDMPYDTLKLDYRALMLNRSRAMDVFLKSIIKIINSNKTQFVITKVETDIELEKIKNMGCNYVQGYAMGMPMSKQEYEKIIF